MKDFLNAMYEGFSNVLNFKGRTSRKTYLIFFLVSYIGLSFIMGILGSMVAMLLIRSKQSLEPLFYLNFVLCVGGFILYPAIMTRRLHDTGKSGIWVFIAFFLMALFLPLFIVTILTNAIPAFVLVLVGALTYIVFILVVVFTFLRGEPDDNKYGPKPHDVEKK